MRLSLASLALSSLAAFGCSGAGASIDNAPPASQGTSGGTSGTVVAPPDAPPATSFPGAANGCGNVFAYRASADGTQYVTVQIDRDELGLKNGETRSIDLASAPPSVKVLVEIFARAPTESRYCTDLRSETLTSTTWTAEAGTLRIELGEKQGDSGSYKATVRVTGLRLIGPERGTSAIVPTVEIKNVLVGWLPG